LRAFFNRRVSLWEGHTRTGLENLVDALAFAQSDPTAIAAATVAFLGEVCKGFSPTAFGDRFEQEARDGCARPCRGKPAEVQNLARFLVNEPNHYGVAKMLRKLFELASNDPHFTDVKIDCHREFWEAGCLGDFENAEAGLAEIAHRRTYSRPKPPDWAISTIHKAKGLECDSVIVPPCNANKFPDSEYARCLLYVALSRAEQCAGIDVGKKCVLVCVLTGGAKDEPRTQIKKFGTIVSELDRLAAWLVAEGCTHAVMESTEATGSLSSTCLRRTSG
jgi:UvrD-like helicase C-terminal domain